LPTLSPGKSWVRPRRRLTLGPPFPARVLELADQLFLLGVHAHHRIADGLVSLDLLDDVPELRVPVRVPPALDGLGVALQAEPLLPQQVTNGVGTDPVTPAGQLGRQVAGRPGAPSGAQFQDAGPGGVFARRGLGAGPVGRLRRSELI
jgi:hypothetical protein